MSLATILPGSSIRVLIYRQLAARRRTSVHWRSNVQCSRHRVTPLRRLSVPIRIDVGVSVSILSTVRLGSVGASPRAERVSSLSVGILRSDFAMLQKQKWGGVPVSQTVRLVRSGVESGTSQFTVAVLAFAQALEQKLCATPEAGSSHLGCR